MKRRNFISATLAASTLGISAKNLSQKNNTEPFIVKSGEARNGIHTPYRGVNPNDLKISGKDTNEQLATFEYIGNVKAGVNLHIHFEQDEIFHILHGEYLFQVGEEKFVVKDGDMVFAPRAVPHAWLQLSEKGRIIYSVQPAGKMEAFFLKMNEFKAPPTFDEVQQIHLAHGMKIVGPALETK